MRFCDKLDFLMKVTNTTNSALSLYTALDPSHISRLRRGQRNAAKNEAYLYKMSSYFARHFSEAYQLRVLLDALGLPQDTYGTGELTEFIFEWLMDKKSAELETVEHFLVEFSGRKARREPGVSEYPANSVPSSVGSYTQFYYGLEGKRQAVLSFLSEVAAQRDPRTILLYSDEAMDWMTENREFAANWASLMSQVLAKGNRIKIIHTVNRDLDEMLSAIIQWLPLYLTDLIEPYYYPKKRDGIFKHTLFIAPKLAAVVSSSVGNMAGEAAILYTREKQAVAAYAQEYSQYLELCRPLMRIYTRVNRDDYFDALLKFEREQSRGIIYTESLSLLTMPDTVALSIAERTGFERDFLDYKRARSNCFFENLKSKSFTEIIHLPRAETAAEGKVAVALSDMIGIAPVCYTGQEYILHLENLTSYLRLYENFHIFFTPDANDDRLLIYAREDFGAFIAKTAFPTAVLQINESNITAAFWDYLKNIIGEKAYSQQSNESAIRTLSAYIEELKCLIV